MTWTAGVKGDGACSDPSQSPSLAASDIIKASRETEADAQCRSCVQLLKQVLQAADSRPTQLLESLFDLDNHDCNASVMSSPAAVPSAVTLRWRHSKGGLQVQIPAPVDDDGAEDVASLAMQRRWSRLHPPEQIEQTKERVGLPLPLLHGQQLATSSLSPDPEDDGTRRKKSREAPQDQGMTEWLSIRCQPCQQTGPEGGARAFVMGPSPLSIVVCTNRLKHTPSNTSAHDRSSLAAARNEMEEILTHELVHVYDVRQLRMDLRDCESLAYSEVRAAREAECRHFPDLHAGLSGPLTRPSWYTLPGMTPSKLACASQTAEAATSNMVSNRRLAKECVDRVLDRAFKDTRPFRKPKDDAKM